MSLVLHCFYLGNETMLQSTDFVVTTLDKYLQFPLLRPKLTGSYRLNYTDMPESNKNRIEIEQKTYETV
jgi:hypothetical protein